GIAAASALGMGAATAMAARSDDSLQDLDLDLTQEAPAAPQAAEPELSMDFALDEPEAPIEAAPAPVEDDNILDFDLGGLNFDTPPAKPAAPAADTPAVQVAQADDLDNAFDLDTIPSIPQTPVVEPKAIEPVPDLSFDMDLPSLDLPASATAAAPAPEEVPAAPAPEASDDFKLDIGNIDFDIPGAPSAAPAPAAEPVEDLPSLDLDAINLDPPEAAPNTIQAAPAPADFDLSDINLDLNASGASDLSDADLSSADVEMDTKLDLALAYQEIGDKEGARELVDEVIAGGSPEQVEKAKAMRAKLA
ncbi:MAG TPA: FimV/HubP family polar landmark protein, partial [Burkholderiaceae bacterium]